LKNKLNILITTDPEITVPPLYYGGIERVVHMLVCELTKRGHKVSLFAHPDSKTPARLAPYRGKRSNYLPDTIINAIHIKRYVQKNGKIDLIHSFGRLAYLLPLLKTPIPKIQSYQRHITPRSIKLGSKLAGKTLAFTACSKFCAGTAKSTLVPWSIIPNGVIMQKYTPEYSVPIDAPLVFLGRIERIKGVQTAIEVAKKTGKRLIIAGSHAERGKDGEYFSKEILPLCDNKTIQYIGAVDDSQKNKLLGKASALLFPIEWDEPFGIVMVEAFACGTPVIALNQGAVPEVIEHKKTGFICESVEDMTSAVKQLPSIDRRSCRRAAEERFSDKVVTGQYEQLYHHCIQKLS